MHRLNELVEKLSPAQLKEVEDFAEFLLSRKSSTSGGARSRFLDVDKIAGMFANLDPGKSSVDLVHETMERWAAKYDK